MVGGRTTERRFGRGGSFGKRAVEREDRRVAGFAWRVEGDCVGQSTTITAAQIWLISASTSMVQIYGVPQTSNTGGGGSGGSSTLQGLTDVSEAASMKDRLLRHSLERLRRT